MKEHHILLVEDDERLAEVILKSLQEKGYATSLATDGAEGLRRWQAGGIDLVITDLILPEMDGMQLSREIRAVDRRVPIIMLTALGTTDDKVEGFDAGADDYLVKPFDIRELYVRIKSLLQRASLVPEAAESNADMLRFADIRIDLQAKKAFREEQELQLTPKEFNLLRYMVEHPMRVLSREEIAKEVWGVDFDTGTNFIDVYINYLRKKVDKPFGEKLIHTRTGMGFVLERS
ncbi:two-component system response regulatory protein [Nitritalea halalkaliphila LW7]|uniref:Two-component system response regulatory protein n=1 Tax=Nitritalea halalkaliphila LW7 TaxID=1189621 RepID=I5C153_9BACT|nr:response regulator transcription factor [Nitritalea halalkaliphila]EIM75555.1 two-component system response regulatory protein [Nitritalea halalkaliphila LW7]